ncbi:HAD hydrolase-like protein [Arthrobacter sp. M2012083]|uniref:HAD family hydrolase n=1 Tax=Arthrobacter sp. M2012083 TaxID=1197706 RepID=UPI00037E5172
MAIFDCDGTILDTEPICAETWAKTLNSYGYPVTSSELAWGTGRTFPTCYRKFAQGRKLLPEKTVHRAYTAFLNRLMATGVDVFPDARQTLHWLAGEGIPIGIATKPQGAP